MSRHGHSTCFKRTVHIPGDHGLPPGISNQIAWELSYGHYGATATLSEGVTTERETAGQRAWDATIGGIGAVVAAEEGPGRRQHTGGGAAVDPHVVRLQLLSRLYASTGAAAWGAGRRAKQGVPVGGWPSGIEFAMGVPVLDLGVSIPPPDANTNADDIRGPLVANTPASISLQQALRHLSSPSTNHQQPLSIIQPSTVQSSTDATNQQSALSAPDHSNNLHSNPSDQSSSPDQSTQDANLPKEESENNVNERWLQWAAALIASSNASRPKPSFLDPIKTASGLHAIHHAIPIPATTSSLSRPLSARSKAARLLPLAVSSTTTTIAATASPSNARKTADSLPTSIPYAVISPNPPPGPPGSADSIVVSNPVHLPFPYATNRRFHSNPIHPDYLVSSDLPIAATHAHPNYPQVYHKESVYMTEFSSRMQIPAKYVAAFNAAAKLNGRPLARATSASLPPSSPSSVTPVASSGSLISLPPNRNGRRVAVGHQRLPPTKISNDDVGENSAAVVVSATTIAVKPINKNAPPILGPLVGSSKVLTKADWQGFQAIEKSLADGIKLASGLSGRDGGELYHGIPPCLTPQEVSNHWKALLTLPGPVGRRGWNHVGR
ncbi:hypothetical protein HK100_011526, partial [Physocladia obscura]